ncbi:MAG: inorganic phosphate transporter [Candidatus Kapabacteria bacterium]|nr:inorganic phosphate transporter [Candidatus Kapabacteria bacterium]
MDYELIIVGLLLLMAIIGLVVGVSNDAVNFMNSAIGAKAAPRKIIVAVCGLGLLVGVTFSSGMMEVARKSIFNPEFFIMTELLVIFTAVMIQNILLLDLFNTFGLPTSTTVSVVFGLFGGALAVSSIKIINEGQSFDMIVQYINTPMVVKIIGAIFLSVLFAFVIGSIVQFVTRLMFTFDFDKKFRRWGSLWSGAALTAITYFILIKGSKGASFMDDELKLWISQNSFILIAYIMVSWTVLMQLLMSFTKVNVLKVVALIGTFALAMAFAANDLVNFIGAPIAGMEAYKLAHESANPFTELMGGLSAKIPANTLILMISGVIMVVTLYFSKKAKTVTKTELGLSRQDEGLERFESNVLARIIVRMVLSFVDGFLKIVPKKLRKWTNKRMDPSKFKPVVDKDGDVQMFDLLRASVNFMVAAVLISFATAQGLPLSTTYVTFIVAMATALQDKSWGRDSAVYRVSGVLTVVGGWFFTAISAAIFAMIIATIIYYGGFAATIGLIILTGYLMWRSSRLHKVREEEEEEKEKVVASEIKTAQEAVTYTCVQVGEYFDSVAKTTNNVFIGINERNHKKLKKAVKQSHKIHANTDILIADLMKIINFMDESDPETGHIFAKAIGGLHEVSSRLRNFSTTNFNYVDNNHHQYTEPQLEELTLVNTSLCDILNKSAKAVKKQKFDKFLNITDSKDLLLDRTAKFNKNQIKRIKKSSTNAKRSLLFLGILDDAGAIAEHSLRATKICRELYVTVQATNNVKLTGVDF